MSGLLLQVDCAGDQGFRLQLDCELPDRGITAIYGRSGSGKSTLLDCVAGLRRPEPGSVLRFRDESWQRGPHFTAPWQRRIGYVFQDARLFPHLSVRQNLDYALIRRTDKSAPTRLDKVIDWLQLADLLEPRPGHAVRRTKATRGNWPRTAVGAAPVAIG